MEQETDQSTPAGGLRPCTRTRGRAREAGDSRSGCAAAQPTAGSGKGRKRCRDVASSRTQHTRQACTRTRAQQCSCAQSQRDETQRDNWREGERQHVNTTCSTRRVQLHYTREKQRSQVRLVCTLRPRLPAARLTPSSNICEGCVKCDQGGTGTREAWRAVFAVSEGILSN